MHLVLVAGGSNAAFYPLVFLHVVAALAGFGSIGFAGTYASRAAQMALFAGEPAARGGTPGSDAGSAGPSAEDSRPQETPRPDDQRPGPSGPKNPALPSSGQVAGGAGGEKATVIPATDAPSSRTPQVGALAGAEPDSYAEQHSYAEPAADAEPNSYDQRVPHAGPRAEAGPDSYAEQHSYAEPAADAEPRPDAEVEELVRYFHRPARFWTAMLAVPIFGVVALSVQPGGGGLDQVWDILALLVWGAASLVAAGVVVPSLRQIRSVLYAPEEAWTSAANRARIIRYGRLASRGAAVCDVLFFVALALMIWKP